MYSFFFFFGTIHLKGNIYKILQLACVDYSFYFWRMDHFYLFSTKTVFAMLTINMVFITLII